MIKDIELRQSVLDELRWDTRVDATHVAVTATDGTVTLTGRVKSLPDIYKVRSAVKRVHGVRAIADELIVELRSEHVQDDSDIATGISLVLKHSLSGTENVVIAEVNQGVVTLRGEVDWQHQRESIEQQIGRVSGIRNIVNLVILRNRPTSDRVKQEIEEALSRNAELESDHVTVTVADDEVILEGHVKALYEKDLVEAAAWHAPGVHKVTNKVDVGLGKN